MVFSFPAKNCRSKHRLVPVAHRLIAWKRCCRLGPWVAVAVPVITRSENQRHFVFSFPVKECRSPPRLVLVWKLLVQGTLLPCCCCCRLGPRVLVVAVLLFTRSEIRRHFVFSSPVKECRSPPRLVPVWKLLVRRYCCCTSSHQDPPACYRKCRSLERCSASLFGLVSPVLLLKRTEPIRSYTVTLPFPFHMHGTHVRIVHVPSTGDSEHR